MRAAFIFMDDEVKYRVGFSVFPGIGPVRFNLLLDYFGSARAAWNASAGDLRNLKVGDKLTWEFDTFRNNFSIPDYLQKLKDEHVFVLTPLHEQYPKNLKSITDAPFVLYVKGRKTGAPWDISRSVAIVGTRKMSPYGQDITRKLTGDLVAAGITIVSGLAWGVDAVAHRTAIESGGKTIAVLGCGVDVIAPAVNTDLYHSIENGNGAIVSEMPLGLRPSKGLFPARNRIISGLSLGVVVTEGAGDSGALITARYAAEQGRDVFAVPGPITSITSKGPSKLLRSGACLVESASDILSELGIGNVPGSSTELKGGSELENDIISVLSLGPRHIDDLLRTLHTPLTTTNIALTQLEMKGIVKDIGNNTFVVNH